MAVLTYDLFMVPASVFHFEKSTQESMRVLQIMCTIYWLSDIPATFFTAVYANNTLLTQRWDIAKEYLQTWFAFDIFVLIPDMYSIATYTDDVSAEAADGVGVVRALRAGRLLRLLRFLRLLRLFKLMKVLRKLIEQVNNAIILLALRIIKYGFMTIYLAHVLACLWFAIGDVDRGWVSLAGREHLERPMAHRLGESGHRQSFHGSITNTMADIERRRQRKKQLLQSVREYCSSHHISVTHAMSIKSYVEREHSRKKSLQAHLELLETLPQDMLRELFHEARSQTLQHHGFFDEMGRRDPPMEMDLCNKALSERFVLVSDKIFIPEQVAVNMYLLSTGQCPMVKCPIQEPAGCQCSKPLRTYYAVTVTDLRVVCLHPDNDVFALVIQVPLLSDCMDHLMSWRRDDFQVAFARQMAASLPRTLAVWWRVRSRLTPVFTFSCRILDPVSSEIKDRVAKVWNTTYWNNTDAFQVCVASLTLALCGENVDRAFWGVGSGGVGQSLQTAHLHLEEMHKQAARLLGKIVVAGQETVQGARKSMREDIYKKHISADKVPERLPYAVDAALVALRGWKRFEMNAYPRLLVKPAFHLCVFLCLSGTLFSFMSFVPSLVPRPWKFVSVTEPAIHFRRTVACRLTCLAVRASCALAVEETGTVDPLEKVLQASEPPPPVNKVQRAKEARAREQNQNVKEIKEWLLQERKDIFTAAQMRAVKGCVSFSFSRRDAGDILEKLAADGRFLSIPLRVRHRSRVKSMGLESSRTLNLKTLAKRYNQQRQGGKKRGAPKRKLTQNGSDVKLGEDLARLADQEGEFEESKTLAEAGEVDEDGLVTVQRQYFYP
ncbi:eag [Symbiodinium natans]|uniref:Eag protein n=1 Tax=Symbiodinium natans TaxID=878477 RepID=A0A812HV52_9DINO|nr:eag [Symbiodinium natans]